MARRLRFVSLPRPPRSGGGLIAREPFGRPSVVASAELASGAIEPPAILRSAIQLQRSYLHATAPAVGEQFLSASRDGLRPGTSQSGMTLLWSDPENGEEPSSSLELGPNSLLPSILWSAPSVRAEHPNSIASSVIARPSVLGIDLRAARQRAPTPGGFLVDGSSAAASPATLELLLRGFRAPPSDLHAAGRLRAVAQWVREGHPGWQVRLALQDGAPVGAIVAQRGDTAPALRWFGSEGASVAAGRMALVDAMRSEFAAGAHLAVGIADDPTPYLEVGFAVFGEFTVRELAAAGAPERATPV